MHYTGYLDFWFRDRPLVERVAAFADLGIRHLNCFFWRQAPIAELAAACKRHGARMYSTFDGDMGSLADPGDNEKTYRSWAESLKMADRFGIPVLYIFSNQIEPAGGVEWVRRLSGNYSAGEQYANLLGQTARILKLVEQTQGSHAKYPSTPPTGRAVFDGRSCAACRPHGRVSSCHRRPDRRSDSQ